MSEANVAAHAVPLHCPSSLLTSTPFSFSEAAISLNMTVLEGFTLSSIGFSVWSTAVALEPVGRAPAVSAGLALPDGLVLLRRATVATAIRTSDRDGLCAITDRALRPISMASGRIGLWGGR